MQNKVTFAPCAFKFSRTPISLKKRVTLSEEAAWVHNLDLDTLKIYTGGGVSVVKAFI